jgi:hypothetical protein
LVVNKFPCMSWGLNVASPTYQPLRKVALH